MRLLVAICACLPALAWADASVPAARDGHEEQTFLTRCGARLEAARREAARVEPVFEHATIDETPEPGDAPGSFRIYRVELRIDETMVGAPHQLIFVAQAWPRRSLWSDPTRTVDR